MQVRRDRPASHCVQEHWRRVTRAMESFLEVDNVDMNLDFEGFHEQ